MRVYAALSGNTRDDNSVLTSVGYPSILVSYATFPSVDDLVGGALAGHRPEALMLDSGAYSVWTKGATVDLAEYVAWAVRARERVQGGALPINLDVIPGDPHRLASRKERDLAAAQSAENAQAIRATGLPAVEVYHRGESLSVLDAILERRQHGEPIAFGGLATGRTRFKREKVEFCDAAFAHLRDRYGWGALPPVHGLGVQPTTMIGRRYPWFSVDSTFWFAMRHFGRQLDRHGRDLPYVRPTRRGTPDTQAMMIRRRLGLWGRIGEELTRLWVERGVRYAA